MIDLFVFVLAGPRSLLDYLNNKILVIFRAPWYTLAGTNTSTFVRTVVLRLCSYRRQRHTPTRVSEDPLRPKLF